MNYSFQAITDWHDRFFKLANSKTSETVLVAYVRDGERARVFKVPIPIDEETWQKQGVSKYIKTYIHNRAWAIGAHRILVSCPKKLYEQIRAAFMTEDGEYHHLASFMTKVYDKQFEIQLVDNEEIVNMTPLPTSEMRYSPKRGVRIGVDLGGSDIKVVALVDGELKFYRKRNWRPMTFTNAEEHLTVVSDMIRMAKTESGLTKLDGVGISTAGVVVNSRIMISGLGVGLTESQFRDKITPMGAIIRARFSGVDVDVAHDGDAAAIWAYVEMGLGNVLGLSLGTGLGAGFADKRGALTGFLCEIGKSLIDMHPEAPEHIYNHTRGAALHYLSQNAAFRLARENGIKIDHIESPAERLRYIQKLVEDGNPKAREIFEKMGHYLAVAVVEFHDYFGMRHVALFGRVTTGIAGEIILSKANRVLNEKFNDIAQKVRLHLPVAQKADVNLNREFGQAIAAAYLSSMRSEARKSK
ncbi:MAG: ROK family protein [Candidatus Poribacteria bacterium]